MKKAIGITPKHYIDITCLHYQIAHLVFHKRRAMSAIEHTHNLNLLFDYTEMIDNCNTQIAQLAVDLPTVQSLNEMAVLVTAEQICDSVLN